MILKFLPAALLLAAFADSPALDFPSSTLAIRSSIAAAVEAGDAGAALAAAQRLAEAGGGVPADERTRLQALIGDETAKPLFEKFAASETPIEASVVTGEIPPIVQLVEGVAFDVVTRRLFTSSVVSRALIYLDGKSFKRVKIERPGSLFGIAPDGARRILWVASGVVPQTPQPETAFSGLIAVSLDTLEETRRIAAPAGMEGALGDVAVGGDGTVYASNGGTGEVFRCRPGCSELEILVPKGRLRSAQGLAVSALGGHLVVADYRHGLAVVDLATREVQAIAPLPGFPIDGVDGIASSGSRLVLVQNGIRPYRITELKMSRDGRFINAARVLERGHKDWGEPTLALIYGTSAIYVSNAGWEFYGDAGKYSGPSSRKPTILRQIALEGS